MNRIFFINDWEIRTSVQISASDQDDFNGNESDSLSESLRLECRLKVETVLRKNGDILLTDVVMASAHSENEASVLFDWTNVESFVQHVISDPPPPSIICPFTLPAPLTVETFKAALLNYLLVPGAMTQPIGTSVIPGTQVQCCGALTSAVVLNFDPWFMAVAGSAADLVPIAELLCLSESCVGTAISPIAKAAGARLWK